MDHLYSFAQSYDCRGFERSVAKPEITSPSVSKRTVCCEWAIKIEIGPVDFFGRCEDRAGLWPLVPSSEWLSWGVARGWYGADLRSCFALVWRGPLVPIGVGGVRRVKQIPCGNDRKKNKVQGQQRVLRCARNDKSELVECGGWLVWIPGFGMDFHDARGWVYGHTIICREFIHSCL